MMYYSILASFCLLGMASSQTIDTLDACVTKDQNLKMECKFIPLKLGSVTCTYKVDKKIVATTGSEPVDATFKNRGIIEINKDICVLTLKEFADEQVKMYNCTIQQEKSITKGRNVEKKSLDTCSAGNSLTHGGMMVLLAFVIPLLSQMI